MGNDRKTAILNLINYIIEQTESLNGAFVDGNDEDTADDLSEEELETLLDQIQEKSNRPRRPIGII